MTTTVKVHVNGNYRATVVQTVPGEAKPRDPVEINHGEERSFSMPHPAHSTFEITEEYLGEKPASAEPPTDQPIATEGDAV